MKKNKNTCQNHRSTLQELACINCTLKPTLQDFIRNTPKRKWDLVGVDGISINHVRTRRESFLKELSTSLKNLAPGGDPSKAYHHDRLRVHAIEKARSNGHRIICVPTIKDRVIQKAILQLLARKNTKRSNFRLDSRISYGVGEKRGVLDAIKRSKQFRQDRPWVFKTDISSFFDNIQRDEIKKVVKLKFPYPSIHPLVFQSIDAEIDDRVSDENKRILADNKIVPGVGLRQGLPLSPLLANLYLFSFDKAVERRQYIAIRYVDDLAFFCKSKEQCEEIYDFCTSELKPLGLEIPTIGTTKTKIHPPNEPAEFLGLEIALLNTGAYTLRISDRQFSKIGQKFKDLSDINLNLAHGKQFINVANTLDTIDSSYKSHYGDADNFPHLEKALYRWREQAYSQIIESAFGKKIDDLDYKVKLFFNIIPNLKIKPSVRS